MKEYDLYVTLSSFAEVNPEPLQILKSSGLSFGINKTGKRPLAEEVLRECQGATVLVAGVEEYDAPTLARFYQEGLRCISRCGVGTENIDRGAAEKLGIKILNTPEEPVQAVAEHTLCLILALLRKLVDLDRDTKAAKWKRHTGNLLKGKIVGLVGYGKIGRRVAELVQAFGTTILVLDPQANQEAEVEKARDLDDLLNRADLVSLHCPAGAIYLGAEQLKKMKEGAWLINTARGDLVDEIALHQALNQGHLAGAALDVFAEEPYQGCLLHNPKTVVTPHQATLTKETRMAMEVKAVKNALNFLRPHLLK